MIYNYNFAANRKHTKIIIK